MSGSVAYVTAREVWPGAPYPLGATFDGAGTNFAVFSELATAIELCLFDERGNEERIMLPESTGFCWHAYLPGVGPGQRYGFRVHGPFEPGAGHRCQPEKLLVDPYARAIEGDVRWDEAVFPYLFNDPSARNRSDSARFMPKSIVINPYFDWTSDRRPRTPWHDTIIYEAHTKGLTRLMHEVPESLRGTFAGLAHPAAINHLTKLGITALELMPVHHFVHDHGLVERGLSNYWGYNTLGFFAPHHAYSSSGARGQQVQEFKHMVRELHAAGIEVILDVVYNHSAEGNHLGPILSWKGLDNVAYYRLVADDPRYYLDYTGTGNSFNMRHAYVLQMIMDSLRYWVSEMHVDGFRFDLASTLARELHEVDRLSAFFDLIHQDPVCRDVKLIAEPWDLGEGGYQVGNFPPLWTEWNGKYRDTVRDYWRGTDEAIPELASRITGSSDLYAPTGRRPYASINFITAHDGFTLADLVSYEQKHNEANGEDNRDGESHNRSWNCGAEGPTEDPAILALRRRQRRNFLTTLLVSQGVPMLLSGDEIGHSQGGNNNAYAQDNATTWIDWDRGDAPLLEFVRRLIALRKRHPSFRRRRFLEGTDEGRRRADIRWHKPDGSEMSEADWQQPFVKSMAVFLSGALPGKGPHGEVVVDSDFSLLFNAHDQPIVFRLPEQRAAVVEVDTMLEDAPERPVRFEAGATVRVGGHSVMVLRHEQ